MASSLLFLLRAIYRSIQDSQDRLRERILRAERSLLHRLGFDFNVEHPYKHLLSVIKSMSHAKLIEDDCTRDLAQVSWNFANDRFVFM